MLKNILLARRINQILGGAFVSPWDVTDMPQVDIDAILSIDRLGEYQAGRRKVADVLDAWRKSHPTYRRAH